MFLFVAFPCFPVVLQIHPGIWKGDSALRALGGLAEVRGFDSQHTHGDSQLETVTPVPGEPTPSSGLHGPCANGTQANICIGKYKIKIKLKMDV